MPSRSRRRRTSSTPIADAVFLKPLTPSALFSDLPTPTRLTEIEDRRSWHPAGAFRPARQISGHPTPPVKVKPAKFKVQIPFGLKFTAPKNTVMCVRRKARREVLFAKKKMGKGQSRRRPRKNWYSKIGC